ncbi:MAG: hypothetical protein ABIK09_20260 [Pseudomonadota bacterium]
MSDFTCPRCGASMEPVDGEWGLISGDDLPRFGSRTEIMITPRRVLRVAALRCVDDACGQLSFHTATPTS